VWFTLKDTGKTQVFSARPPFALLKTLDTGANTNHVNFAVKAQGTYAYVTVGGLNQVQVFRADDFERVATISVGNLPHGVWPSGDGSCVYVGLENDDRMLAIDTTTNAVIASIAIGQAPQAVVYVPNAVEPGATATPGLSPLGLAGGTTRLSLINTDRLSTGHPTSSVTLFDQGLVQVLEAAVTGLKPLHEYVLGLANRSDGGGAIEGLAHFKTNPAGAAILNAVGPIRQIVDPNAASARRYLVIIEGSVDGSPILVQVQSRPL
jgi:YVTN family beta-propeller protein